MLPLPEPPGSSCGGVRDARGAAACNACEQPVPRRASAERNAAAGSTGPPSEADRAAALARKTKLADAKRSVDERTAALAELARQLPCESHPAAPIGPESAAVTTATLGTRRQFDFVPRDHVELGRGLGMFDFGAATAVAGAGFVVLRDDGVLLEQALVSWALAHAQRAGFSLVAGPDLALSSVVEGCGFNPRPSGTAAADGSGASSQVYSVADSPLCLVGTSEITVAGLHAGQVIPAAALPTRYAAVSHCFRREAGSYGQRDRGLYRLHQFTKVELFAFVAPSKVWAKGAAPVPLPPDPASEAMLTGIVALQCRMYEELGLHVRLLDMPTEELGAAAYRKYDIEAWMPCRGKPSGGSGSGDGWGAWGEVSSASNCVDYQARRLNIRCKTGSAGGGEDASMAFVHTLNGTACAIPRVMLALLETHQNRDGSVNVPPPLQPYLGGRSVLRPRASSAA